MQCYAKFMQMLCKKWFCSAGVSLHVLSKSPLIHTDASEVTRIFFDHYSIHHCNASLNWREHIHLFDRREQLDTGAVRISQADISTTVPI